MGRFGLIEILILIGIALLLFGGGRVADVGRGTRGGIRGFKRGLREGEAPEGPPDGEAKPASVPAESLPETRDPES